MLCAAYRDQRTTCGNTVLSWMIWVQGVNDKPSDMVASIFKRGAISLAAFTFAIVNVGLTSSFFILKHQLFSLS